MAHTLNNSGIHNQNPNTVMRQKKDSHPAQHRTFEANSWSMAHKEAKR